MSPSSSPIMRAAADGWEPLRLCVAGPASEGPVLQRAAADGGEPHGPPAAGPDLLQHVGADGGGSGGSESSLPLSWSFCLLQYPLSSAASASSASSLFFLMTRLSGFSSSSLGWLG